MRIEKPKQYFTPSTIVWWGEVFKQWALCHSPQYDHLCVKFYVWHGIIYVESALINNRMWIDYHGICERLGINFESNELVIKQCFTEFYKLDNTTIYPAQDTRTIWNNIIDLEPIK